MTTTVRLGDICEMRSGGTPRRGVDGYYGGKIPWVTIADMSASDGIVSKTVECITESGLSAIGNRLFQEGTILLAMYGSVGKLAVAGCPLATNQAILGLRPRNPDVLDSRYLKSWLASIQPKLLFDARGVTQANISKSLVEELLIPLPTLWEQRRIANILDKADAIRRKRKEAIALTEELLRSTFLEMFGDPVTNPKAWPVTTLGDEASQMKYGTSEKCGSESPGALPVLRIPNVIGGEIDWGDLKYANLDSGEVEGLRLRSGDLLFVRSNGNPDYIGRCAVYNSERIALFASYLIRVRLNAEHLHPTYVRAALSSASYRARLASEARTTAGNYNISTEGLRRLRLPLPPMAMQVRFAELDAATRQSRERLKLAEHHAERVFSALVQQAFTTGDRLPC